VGAGITLDMGGYLGSSRAVGKRNCVADSSWGQVGEVGVRRGATPLQDLQTDEKVCNLMLCSMNAIQCPLACCVPLAPHPQHTSLSCTPLCWQLTPTPSMHLLPRPTLLCFLTTITLLFSLPRTPHTPHTRPSLPHTLPNTHPAALQFLCLSLLPFLQVGWVCDYDGTRPQHPPPTNILFFVRTPLEAAVNSSSSSSTPPPNSSDQQLQQAAGPTAASGTPSSSSSSSHMCLVLLHCVESLGVTVMAQNPAVCKHLRADVNRCKNGGRGSGSGRKRKRRKEESEQEEEEWEEMERTEPEAQTGTGGEGGSQPRPGFDSGALLLHIDPHSGRRLGGCALSNGRPCALEQPGGGGVSSVGWGVEGAYGCK
jgi:hypothetical protein